MAHIIAAAALTLLAAQAVADPPCRAPHPLVSQAHVAPRSPTIALLAIQYSDYTGPSVNETLLRACKDVLVAKGIGCHI